MGKIALKWVGGLMGFDGLAGIPGRDLTAEEAAEHGGIDWLVGTGLYVLVESVKPAPTKRKKKESIAETEKEN